MSRNNAPVEIDCWHHPGMDTGAAIACSLDDRPKNAKFFPKKFASTTPRRLPQKQFAKCGDPVTLTIPQWLAEDRGWEDHAN